MKLSDAILKGCKGTKKCVGTFAKGKTRCCALGAAMIAKKITPDYEGQDILMDQYPFLRQNIEASKDPLKSTIPRALGRTITMLNDNYGWSRLKIAKWLKSLGY